MLAQTKRVLREHPYTRCLYTKVALQWTRTSISFYQQVFGRYHTAKRFDRLFARRSDPWGYHSDPVSEERRELVLKTLPRNRYHRLLEIGCAEGLITLSLANRADELVAADISCVALGRARENCRHLANVRFAQLDLLVDPLSGSFDGIVCAGVLVFLPSVAQPKVRDRLVASLESGGDLLLEHTKRAYPGEIAGSEIHALYRDHPELTVLEHEEVDNYAITLFRRMVL